MFHITSHIQITHPLFKANPFPYYAHLRQIAPVLRLPSYDGNGNMWLVTRYQDAVAVLKDERFVKDRRNAMNAGELAQVPADVGQFNLMAYSLLERDGETHRRLRTLVHKAFTPQLIEHLRGRIEHISDELLTAMEKKGTTDLIADFAFPLPIIVICEMLGVPSEDRDQFRAWSNALLNHEEGSQTPMSALVGYLWGIIEQRRKQPKDDLISKLIEAKEAGGSLSDMELLAMVFLLLVAGHETTVNLIGNGVLALLENKPQLDKLRRQPTLIKTAVEELLRFTSPVEFATERYASEDISVGDVVIPRGDLVLVSLASANHDPSQFADPERLDITREDNKHIAFGFGAHYCLGAPLARLEAGIALPMLLERLPNLKLVSTASRLRWRPSLFLRGLEALPVTF